MSRRLLNNGTRDFTVSSKDLLSTDKPSERKLKGDVAIITFGAKVEVSDELAKVLLKDYARDFVDLDSDKPRIKRRVRQPA